VCSRDGYWLFIKISEFVLHSFQTKKELIHGTLIIVAFIGLNHYFIPLWIILFIIYEYCNGK
jgi:hypothetical protein